jgi:hypothetical protein
VVVGWVCDDAWFGIIMAVVGVKKFLNVESTWIIKSNHSFSLMEALHSILKGKFGSKVVGHWVYTTTKIGGQSGRCVILSVHLWQHISFIGYVQAQL